MTPDEAQQVFDLFSFQGELGYFTKGHRGAIGGAVRSPAGLHRMVEQLNLDNDIYLNVNPAKGYGIKSALRHVTHLRYFLVDIDPSHSHGTQTEYHNPIEWIFSVVHPICGGRPPIIETGRGLQVWFPIIPLALPPESVHRVQVEYARLTSYLHRICPAFGWFVDTSCTDLSRVGRCPYTINHRSGNFTSIVPMIESMMKPMPWSYYTALLADEPVELTARPALLQVEGEWNLERVLAHLTRRACDFLTSGVVQPGRHSAAFAAAASLAEAGVPQDVSLAWVIAGGQHCHPPLPRDAAHTACHNAYQSVYRKLGL